MDDLIQMVEAGEPLPRSKEHYELASLAADRAQKIRENPPSASDLKKWAERLGREAADLCD